MKDRNYFVDLPTSTTYKYNKDIDIDIVIADLLKIKLKTENSDIKEIIDIFISNLTTKNYLCEDYFEYRRNLSLLSNDFIKHSLEFIKEIISKDNNEVRSYVKKLSDSNMFSISNERKTIVKEKKEIVNDKEITKKYNEYVVVKKEIKPADILLYAKEFHSHVNQLLTQIIVESNTDILAMKDKLENDEIIKLIKKQYEQEFSYIKSLDVDLFTELYENYRNNIKEIMLDIVKIRTNQFAEKQGRTAYWKYFEENRQEYLNKQVKSKLRRPKRR